MNIHVKRIYDPPSPEDGHRVLVDRLWPRGITRARAAIDLWLQEIAPSPELRQWYAHDPWSAGGSSRFVTRQELEERPEAVATLLEFAPRGPLTLPSAARPGAQQRGPGQAVPGGPPPAPRCGVLPDHAPLPAPPQPPEPPAGVTEKK